MVVLKHHWPLMQVSMPQMQDREMLLMLASPFAGDGMLHLKLHVVYHRAGVDVGGAHLFKTPRPGC